MATRTAPVIPIGTWTVDPAHSSVGFTVKHMGIANVRGQFTEFEGTLEMKEALSDCRARGTVKVASVDTGDAGRDDHLRSGVLVETSITARLSGSLAPSARVRWPWRSPDRRLAGLVLGA